MNLQDRTNTRSAAALEMKYKFDKILGLSANVESNGENIVKVENELVNMLNTLIINLGDVLDSQSSISLWFYSGIPTKANVPYTTWSNPSEHIGDIYYNQATGYVYKYTSSGWVLQEDINLISAMALTNADLDVSEDHERKVYFSKPTPAYSSGDWWILEDGTLKICQLGKASGEEYNEQDFVVSSKYTTTVATKQGDTITVLKGTVTQITEDYVKYTDLGTGGSTTIAGERITTGNIKSNNYVEGTSGTNINLTTGEIKTKNVKLDDEGLKLSNGAKVVGNNGLKNTYLFGSKGNGTFCGVESAGYMYETNRKEGSIVEFVIPKGLEVTSAKVHLFHNPVFWSTQEETYPIGYVRNLKLYKATNVNTRQIVAYSGSEMFDDDMTTYSDLNITWYNKNGTSKGTSFTAAVPSSSSHVLEEIYSSDISSMFKTNNVTIPGIYQVKVETADSISTSWSETECCLRTGWVYLEVEIEGYMTYS